MAERCVNGVRFIYPRIEYLSLQTTLFIKYLDKFWNLVGLQNVPDSSEDVRRDADILKEEKLLTS